MFIKKPARYYTSSGIRVNNVAHDMVSTKLNRSVENEMMMKKDTLVSWIIEQSIASGQFLIPREG